MPSPAKKNVSLKSTAKEIKLDDAKPEKASRKLSSVKSNTRNLEEELKTALTRFDLVNKGSNDGLRDMAYPNDGQLLPDTPFWWSEQFRALVGFKDEEEFPNVLSSWASRLHENDAARTFAAFEAHLKDRTGKTPYDVEYQLKLKDETYRWFRAKGHTLRDPDGRPLRVAGSLKDITEDKIRENTLQTALVRFDLVNKSSSEGLWDMVYPQDGQLLPDTPFWWSEQFRKLVGFTTEAEFPNILSSWASRLHEEDAGKTFDAFKAHLTDRTGQTPYDVEYRLKLKNNDYRWFKAKGFTLRDSEGNPLRVAGSLKDITDEKIQEAHLKTALMRFDLVNKSSSQGLWDMVYPENGEILPQTPFWWSDQFRAMVGFQNEADFPNVLDSWGSRLHAEDAANTFAAFQAHLNDKTGKTPYDIEYRLLLKKGEYRWFKARGFTLRDAKGNPLRVAGALIDIHEEKQQEEKLARTLADLKNAFTGIRTSVSSLQATSQTMTTHSDNLIANSSATSENALSATQFSDQVVRNVQTVATAAEEMSVTIKVIARNVTEAKDVAQNAVEHATDANNTIGRLGESSKQIGKVIKVITTIAQQTNLLALNATLEAGRAGEAGKGFAVVANQIKDLAKETAAATEDISERIQAIQEGTAQAVAAINHIGNIISKISSIQGTIANSIDEQALATSSIASNASDAALKTNEISSRISVVAKMSEQTRGIAQATKECSAELTAISSELNKIDK